MQTIKHQYDNRHKIFNQMETLYSQISDENTKPSLFKPVYYDCFRPLFHIFADYIWDFQMPNKYAKNPNADRERKNSGREVIVCISGGKDSVATALYYKNRGYSVHLYHMRGINKVYTDEYKAVEEIAKALDMPLFVDTITLSGTQRFVEHPMKNMMIANGALHYALKLYIDLNIAFGNFRFSSLKDNPFDVCAGDCMEMWRAYESIVSTVFPGFKIKTPLSDNRQTFDLIECDTKLMRLCQSCISPQRFREHWRKRAESTYEGLHLWEHRCGGCWKCAMEYIYCVDHKLQDAHSDYYFHCIDILYKTLRKESEIDSRSVLDVWKRYLFYDIKKSTYFKELQNATFSGGKIKK